MEHAPSVVAYLATCHRRLLCPRGPPVRRQHGLLRRALDLPAPGPGDRRRIVLHRGGSGARLRGRSGRAGTPIDAETIGGVIDSAIESRGTITIISFGFLLWGALGIFSAMSGGISRAFDNAPPRPFVKERLIGLLLMAVTGLLAASSLIIGIVTGILQQAAGDVLSSVPGRGSAVWLIGLLLPIVLIFLAFWVIYRVVPNRRVTLGRGAAGCRGGGPALDGASLRLHLVCHQRGRLRECLRADLDRDHAPGLPVLRQRHRAGRRRVRAGHQRSRTRSGRSRPPIRASCRFPRARRSARHQRRGRASHAGSCSAPAP